MVIPGLVLVAAGIWFSLSHDNPLVFSDGTRLEVLEVQSGTNLIFSLAPRWQQLLGRVVLDDWEKPLGLQLNRHTNQTAHGSLLLVVRELSVGDTVEGNPAPRFEVLFDEHFTAPGQMIESAGRRRAIQFPVYPRDREQLEIRATRGTEIRTFRVANAQPVAPAAWLAGDLPQTNTTATSRIVLRQLGWAGRPNSSAPVPAVRVGARLSTLGETTPGWSRASFTLEDRLGNPVDKGWINSGPLALPGHLPELKLTILFEEYLSAGFVPAHPREDWIPLTISARARQLGWRHAAVVQPGRYRMSDDGRMERLGDAIAVPDLNWSSTDDGEPVLTLDTGAPGLLLVADERETGGGFEARLRERTGANGGNLFPHRVAAKADHRSAGQSRIARFLVNRRRSEPDRTITGEARLEAELIYRHPPADFLVQLKSEQQLRESPATAR